MIEDGMYFIVLFIDKYYIKLFNYMYVGSIYILMMKSCFIFFMMKYWKFVYLYC